MISRYSAALLACTLLVATPVHAQGAPVTAADLQALQAQIQALQAQVEQLKVAQAQAAQTAQAAAAAPQSTPPLKQESAGWFANTSISGKAFFNASNINQKSTDLAGVTTDNAQNGAQTELKRFYIGIDHK